MTPAQFVDLLRATILVDMARAKLEGLPIKYPALKRTWNLRELLDASLGNVLMNDRETYEAGIALYHEWYGGRYDEEKRLDTSRNAALAASGEGE